MIASLVLITGVVLVVVVGSVVLSLMGLSGILPSLVPLAPWLVMVGTAMLMLTELLLLFGSSEDRKTARRDLNYLLPTFFVSAALWYVAQKLLW
jgi:hypothetical protein